MASAFKKSKLHDEKADKMIIFPLILDGIRFDVSNDGQSLLISDLFLEKSQLLSFLKVENVLNICLTENDVVFQLRDGLTVDKNALFVALSLPLKTVYIYSNYNWTELEYSEGTSSTLFGESDSVIASRKRTIIRPQAGNCCCTTLYEIHLFEIDSNKKTVWKVFPSCRENVKIYKMLELFIKQICAGSNHILILDESGRVFVYGSGLHGELGLGSFQLSTDDEFLEIEQLQEQIPDGITQIASGFFHNLILSNSGDVYAFGWNKNGVLGPGMSENSKMIMEPFPMDLPRCVVKIEAENYVSRVFYDDGTIECFGDDSSLIFDIK